MCNYFSICIFISAGTAVAEGDHIILICGCFLEFIALYPDNLLKSVLTPVIISLAAICTITVPVVILAILFYKLKDVQGLLCVEICIKYCIRL